MCLNPSQSDLSRDEMLENRKTWVALVFPTVKEPVISELQEPWVLLCQRTKKRRVPGTDQLTLDVVNIFYLLPQRTRPSPRRSPLIQNMCLFRADVYKTFGGSLEDRSCLERQQS